MKSKIRVSFKPIYELATSLMVFSDKTMLRNSEMGTEWANEIKKQLKPDLLKQMQNKSIKKSLSDIVELMVVFSDQPFDTFEEFCAWLNKMSIGELAEYTSLTPMLLQDFLPNLENLASINKIMKEWEKSYFNTFDPNIIKMLTDEARDKENLARDMQPQDLIEQLTGGVRLENLKEKTLVFLVPQYHGRPFNIYALKKDLFIVHYPVDIEPVPGEPSPKLLRLTSALCDGNRLKIMRHLARGESTFMKVVSFLGISKSTVHYHMASLRAAGLIRVHISENDSISYSLRLNTLNETSGDIKDFIMQPDNEKAAVNIKDL